MKTVFIIAEYNPFHLGHKHHLAAIKQELKPDCIVALMSGNFVQRGEPAIFDKFARAHLAGLAGVDLVLELPVVYSVSSAEYFAFGGVQLAHQLDPEATLSFGSESGDLRKIVATAKEFIDNEEEIWEEIRQLQREGHSFPKSLSLAHEKLTAESSMRKETLPLSQPNDILAVTYAKAALRLRAPLSLHTIARKGQGYHDKGLDHKMLPSATALRTALKDGQGILFGLPEETRESFQSYLKAQSVPDLALLAKLTAHRLAIFPDLLDAFPEAASGLKDQVLKHRFLGQQGQWQDWILACQSKNFTYTRISRLLLWTALGFDQIKLDQRRQQPPAYVRILAFNHKGQEFLKKQRHREGLRLLHSFKNIPQELIQPELLASALYALLCPTYDSQADFRRTLKPLSKIPEE